MPICLIDGFDTFTLTQATSFSEWSGTRDNISTANGRRANSKAMAISGSNGLWRPIATSQAYRIGFAFNISSGTLYWGDLRIAGFCNGPGNVNWQVGMAIDASTKRLKLIRGNGTVVATGTEAIPLNTWQYFEWYIVITDTLSTNQSYVKINNNDFFIVSSGDTKNDTSSTADYFALSGSNATTILYDDLYISTEAVTTSPTFNGDMVVSTLAPVFSGSNSGFVGSDGDQVNNYAMLNQLPSSLTSSVYGPTVNSKDSYYFSTFTGANPQIKALNNVIITNKTDVGNTIYTPFYKIGGTEYDLSDIASAVGYNAVSTVSETNPATGTAWIPAAVSNIEAGIKRKA